MTLVSICIGNFYPRDLKHSRLQNFSFIIFYVLSCVFKVLNFLCVFHPNLTPLHEMCGFGICDLSNKYLLIIQLSSI